MKLIFNPGYITNNVIFWIYIVLMIAIIVATTIFVIKEVGGKK